MKNYLSIIALVMGIILSVSVNTSMALESDTNQNIRGVVVDIDPEQIIVQEIREEGDQISQFEIAIDTDTLFKDDSTSEDIAQGDEVEIEFKETENGKVAVLILEQMAEEAIDIESEILEKL